MSLDLWLQKEEGEEAKPKEKLDRIQDYAKVNKIALRIEWTGDSRKVYEEELKERNKSLRKAKTRRFKFISDLPRSLQSVATSLISSGYAKDEKEALEYIEREMERGTIIEM